MFVQFGGPDDMSFSKPTASVGILWALETALEELIKEVNHADDH